MSKKQSVPRVATIRTTLKKTVRFVGAMRIAGRLTIVLAFGACTASCMVDLRKIACFPGFMKAEMRISIKDYHRNKSLKILLNSPAGSSWWWMDGEPWLWWRGPYWWAAVEGGASGLLSPCPHSSEAEEWGSEPMGPCTRGDALTRLPRATVLSPFGALGLARCARIGGGAGGGEEAHGEGRDGVLEWWTDGATQPSLSSRGGQGRSRRWSDG